MKATIEKLKGANMDIDLITSDKITWEQDKCPWNKEDNSSTHNCAIKDVSICPYFCGIEYLDTIVCCYPNENPYKQK